ncbi:MAG: WG repeat-containing protein [Alistipes sp.]
MTATIHTLITALALPAHSFSTLGALQPVCDATGTPQLCRRTYFMEAKVVWQGALYLLCCPLCSAAIPKIEQTVSQLKYIRSEHLLPCRILRQEMHYIDALGEEQTIDILLQALPEGVSLTEALHTGFDGQQLLAALDELEAEFQRIGFNHNNLTAENILVTAVGKLMAIRHYHARFDIGSDAEAFKALRQLVAENSFSGELHDLPAPTYRITQPDFSHHHWVGRLSEQLIRIEEQSGYGFVDTSDIIVIEPHFLWADDFHEGRAAVETTSGMGLINKQGDYILKPCYEIVDYDDRTGETRVRLNGQWALFDYLGKQLSAFAPRAEAPYMNQA